MDKDDLRIKQILTSDPNTRDPEVLQYLANSEACSEFAQKLKQFDDKLKSALHIDVPEGLESRIILAQRMMHTEDTMQGDNVTSINHARKKTTENDSGKRDFRWMSLAAALVLAIGLSFGMFKVGESQGLQTEVLAHIESHLNELEVDNNIKLASLNTFLQEHGLSVNENIGHVRYMSNCPIQDKVVPHMVVADQQGKPVTVMYIPWEKSAKSSTFKNENFSGVLVGAEKGSFVIVSDDPSSLQSMEDRVLNGMEIDI